MTLANPRDLQQPTAELTLLHVSWDLYAPGQSAPSIATAEIDLARPRFTLRDPQGRTIASLPLHIFQDAQGWRDVRSHDGQSFSAILSDTGAVLFARTNLIGPDPPPGGLQVPAGRYEVRRLPS